MLVTIHNLPVHIRYSDIKNLLQSKCGFSEVILDNLVNEGKTKKVTVGLPEEEDAAILTRNINGLYYDGRQLYVKDVRQKTPSDQPYHKGSTSADQPRSNYQQSNYQQSNYQQSNYQQSNYQAQLQTPIGYPMQMNSLQDYQNYQNYQAQGYQAMMAPMMDMPYYMQAQSAYMGYPGQGQTGATPQYSQFGQQERTQNSSGMGNDQNNRSRQWDNNEQSSYQNRQRSPSPSQGRSRWDNDRNRSRSPPRRGRSRDRGQRSPNRSDRGPYGNQGSRNEAYTSRGSFGGQNSGSSSNQAGPNRAAISPWESGPNSQNNTRAQNPIEQEPQARNWERKAGPVMYNQGPSQNTWQRDRDNSSGGNSSANQWNRSGSFQDSSQTSGFQNRQQNTWKRPNTDFDQSQPKRSRFDQQSQPSRFDRSGNSGPSGQNQRPQSQYQSGKNSNFRAGAAGNKNQPWNNQRPNQSPRNGNAGPSANSKNSPKDIATYIRNDMANRNQACQELANKIRKVSPEFMADDNLVKLLRKAVRGRLECLLVDSIGITPKEMMEKYRKKFSVPSDNTLCNAIIKRAAEEAAAAEASATNAVPKEEEPVFKPPAKPSVATPTSGAQNKPVNKPAPVKQLPTFKAPEGGKLPTYPNADKRVYKNIKQLQKAEHRDDDFYKEEMRSKLPLEEEILVREVDAIVDIFKNVFENPVDEKDKPACDLILRGETLKELRRAVKLNATKRILDIRTNLMVRINSHGRPPKKADLEDYMSQFDVVSMKKSKSKVPLYLVTCATYETYDRLIELAEASLGDVNLSFRPFQLLGPGLSCRERMLKRGYDKAGERRDIDMAIQLMKNPGAKIDFSESAPEDLDEKDMDETAEEAGEGGFDEEQDTEANEGGALDEEQDADGELNEEDFEEW